MKFWPKMPRKWIEAEVGEECIQFLSQVFFPHLFRRLPKREEIKFRLAPSIITRSECEILSLSAPRFAVRAEFTDGSFVNLRRLHSASRWAPEWVAPEHSHLNFRPDKTLFSVAPGDLVRKGCERSLADGLLIPPSELARKFQFLTTDLFAAYGERDCGLRAVPFVQSVQLGGGLCAQAVAYMATCILSEATSGIHGLGEISAIAHKKAGAKGRGAIPIGGLAATDVCDYLNSDHVGLGAKLMSTSMHQLLCGDQKPRKWMELFAASLAIHANVISGMPVIALVDVKKLENFYERFGLENNFRDLSGPHRHALIVVATQSTKPWNVTFLVNDPSYLPMMSITIDEISRARQDERFLSFVATTPRQVRTNLLDSAYPERSCGLLHVFSNIARNLGEAQGGDTSLARCFARSTSGRFTFGEFLLLPPGFDPKADQLMRAQLSPPEVLAVANVRASLGNTHWHWLQKRETGAGYAIILWQTEHAIPISARLPSKALDSCQLIDTALISSDGIDWKTVWPREALKQRNAKDSSQDLSEQPHNSRFALSPSVISSFVCSSIFKSCRILANCSERKRFNLVDIYTLMQSEPEIDSQVTAEEYLAGIANDECALAELANRIHKALDLAGLRPGGMATFFPGMSVPASEKRARISREALFTCCKISGLLSEYGYGIPAIEMVGGSRVMGLWPGVKENRHGYDTERAFLANLISQDDGLSNIVENVDSVFRRLRQVTANQTVPRLAIELEPGPLFCVNSLESMVALLKKVDQRTGLSEFLGLNLDIAHWQMAGVCIEKAKSDTRLLDSIWHAHISGHHHAAHFGDIPPLSLNAEASFLPWLDLLEELTERKRGYSGNVALELEAAKSPEEMEQAIRDLLHLLGFANDSTL